MSLGSECEESVRVAVEAYLEGRLRPDLDGEALFETRNSRYRLIDGVLFSASDASLVGAELVGWLTESEDSSAVGAWWSPGLRAVLVNRRQGRHIVVTSATRVLKRDRSSGAEISAGSDAHQGGSVTAHVPDLVSPAVAAAAVAAGVVSRPSGVVSPPPLPRRAQIPPCPQLPPQRRPVTGPSNPISMSIHPSTAPASMAPAPVSARPATPVHLPPRPIARSVPSIARPLPFPSAPPQRRASSPELAPASMPLPRYPSSSSNALPASAMHREAPPRARPLPPPPGPLASPSAMVPPPPQGMPYPYRGAYSRDATLR